MTREDLQLSLFAQAASDSADGGPNSLCNRLGLTAPLVKKTFVESHFCVSYAMASSAGAIQEYFS